MVTGWVDQPTTGNFHTENVVYFDAVIPHSTVISMLFSKWPETSTLEMSFDKICSAVSLLSSSSSQSVILPQTTSSASKVFSKSTVKQCFFRDFFFRSCDPSLFDYSLQWIQEDLLPTFSRHDEKIMPKVSSMTHFRIWKFEFLRLASLQSVPRGIFRT